jgi:hypothetical protein
MGMISEPFYEALKVAAGPVSAPFFTWMEIVELFPNRSSKVDALLKVVEEKKWAAQTALQGQKYFFRMENESHRFTVLVVQEEFDLARFDILAEVLYRLLLSI